MRTFPKNTNVITLAGYRATPRELRGAAFTHSIVDATGRRCDDSARAQLTPDTRVTDLLFIRRAEKSGDPWSGHMAFPGGHMESSDASLLAAAIRETQEEIGLDLLDARQHTSARLIINARNRAADR